jgi:hypothetical protein
MLQKLLTAEVTLFDALLGKAVYNLSLSCDRGMISAWHPQSILAVKACLANQDVLNGIVEHMAHVEHACHVWRRNYNSVRLTPVGLRLKQAVLQPIFIPFALNLLGTIFASEFHKIGVFQNLTAKLVQTKRKTKEIF